MKVGQLEKNQNRNRFVDIIPYDDNYVSLQVSRKSINSEVTSLILFSEGARPSLIHLCQRLIRRRPRGSRQSDSHTGQ